MGEREPKLKQEVSTRLQGALSVRKRSIRSLEAAMTDRGSDITSYGAIRAYVQGGKLPPLTFLLEAADELEVRAEWLILGEGEMMEAQQQAEEEEDAALLAACPQLRTWPEETRPALVQLVAGYLLQTDDQSNGLAIWPELLQDIAFLTTLPLRCWGLRSLEEMAERERTTYLFAMLNALRIALHDVGKGDPLEEREDSLLPDLRLDWS